MAIQFRTGDGHRKGTSGNQWTAAFRCRKCRGTPTWRPICDLMVRREGNLNPTLAHRKDYQAYRLGRSNEAALLLELLPYPHRKLSEWTYKKWERFNTRAEYLESLLPLRKRLLRSLLNEAPREFIVCYGKKYWCHYKDLFGDANWENLSSFRRARTNATTIVLTYHFSRSHFWPDRTLAQLHRAVCIGVAH